MNTCIVLLGAPGVGKGTFRDKVVEELESTNIRYSVIECSSYLKQSKRFQRIIDSGGLVNDNDVNQIMKEALLSIPEDTLIILDGYPRTIKQAKFLLNLTDKDGYIFDFIGIKLNADDEEIIKRVENRRVCSNLECGATYNLVNAKLKPQKEGICDHCGAELIIREDDSKIRERLDVYNRETEPAINWLKSLDQDEFEYYEWDSSEILTKRFARNVLFAVTLSEEFIPPKK